MRSLAPRSNALTLTIDATTTNQIAPLLVRQIRKRRYHCISQRNLTPRRENVMLHPTAGIELDMDINVRPMSRIEASPNPMLNIDNQSIDTRDLQLSTDVRVVHQCGDHLDLVTFTLPPSYALRGRNTPDGPTSASFVVTPR